MLGATVSEPSASPDSPPVDPAIDSVDRLCCGVADFRAATDLYLAEGARPHLRANDAVSSIEGTDSLTRADLEAFWRHCGAPVEETTDFDTAYVASNGRRFRVNLHLQLGRLAAVLRPIQVQIPSFEDLALPETLLSDWATRKSGIVLVTGPTGCGKSTTVAACLEHLNATRPVHIVTIEDPIEFLFTPKNAIFTQRQVGNDTPSFFQGLRTALRQSPHVIFLGEIRDPETAMTALQAAETGHLVFTTLHSRSVPDAFERLVNLFPPDRRDSALLILSMQLIGILAQRLLPSTSGSLTPVFEHVQNQGGTRKWIREAEHRLLADHLQRGDDPANASFLQSILAACDQGRIDDAVAEKACDSPGDFQRARKGISGKITSR